MNKPVHWLTCALLAVSLHAEANVGLVQKPGATLPLATELTDSDGRAVPLGRYFGQRPVVLAFGYYGCPNLCGTLLNGIAEGTGQAHAQIGRDAELLFVSIDPRETAPLAAAKKTALSTRYRRPDLLNAHFLTGRPAALAALEDSTGVHTRYDAALDQYLHPAGLIVVSPRGRIVQYLPGVRFAAPELGAALAAARRERADGIGERLVLLCSRFDAGIGRHDSGVMNGIRLASLGLAGSLLVLIWRLQGARR